MESKNRFMIALAILATLFSTIAAAAVSTEAAMPPRLCVSFAELKLGDSGAGVGALQDALAREGFYDGGDSYGYFGEHTASAVSGFQQKYADSILAPRGLKYGTGYVDRETAGGLNRIYGCAKNQPPVINGVSGPVGLNAGEAGTWTINANDPDGKALYYSVSWGDEYRVPSTDAPAATAGTTQTATFTHSYAQAGTYTITFTVADGDGGTARSTITVSVTSAKEEYGSARITVMDTLCAGAEYATDGEYLQKAYPCGRTRYDATVELYEISGPYLYAGGAEGASTAQAGRECAYGGCAPPARKYVGTRDTRAGAAVFENLEPGTYEAIAYVDGYAFSSAVITVNAGMQSITTIYMYDKNVAYAPDATGTSPIADAASTVGQAIRIGLPEPMRYVMDAFGKLIG
ncbi:PKD domain protein [uncultured archaeon]|nr:PKD domain protein [uncultured archaeon]